MRNSVLQYFLEKKFLTFEFGFKYCTHNTAVKIQKHTWENVRQYWNLLEHVRTRKNIFENFGAC